MKERQERETQRERERKGGIQRERQREREKRSDTERERDREGKVRSGGGQHMGGAGWMTKTTRDKSGVKGYSPHPDVPDVISSGSLSMHYSHTFLSTCVCVCVFVCVCVCVFVCVYVLKRERTIEYADMLTLLIIRKKCW